MENSKAARTFLMLNAMFSLVTGISLLIMPGLAAHLIFVESNGWPPIILRVLGIGLLLFGLDLIVTATNRFLTKRQVMLISAMDIGWVLGSGLLVFLDGYLFTDIGKVVIGMVALFVAIFAIGQYAGAQKIVPPKSQASVKIFEGNILASVTRKVEAPKSTVWRVMNDHPRYADVADNISKVEVLGGDGLGMQRRCYGPKGENWLETCDLYEDERVFGFRIHTEADDYPYPLSDLRGEWSVEPNGSGSIFTINIKATPSGNLLVRAIFKMAAKRQFKAVLVDLADAWAVRMEREARA